MLILKILFWLSLFIVFYSYLGYGILVFLLVHIKRIFLNPKKSASDYELPNIALIIAAYNEEDYILEKIANTKALIYPEGRLRVVFITDGSTDSTPELITKQSDYEVLHQPERRGKAFAMNRAMHFVTEPILVFCDANTILNPECILEIAKHYENEKVGGVAGEKRIMKLQDGKAVAAGEGLYWQYESFLKKMDSELNSVVGAAGELFSIRKKLYQPILEGTIIEDFVLTMQICEKGYKVKYEPNAYAIETASASMRDEEKRKIRISAGAFQAMAMLSGLLNIFKHGLLSFQYISHRVLRWSICPLCLVALFITNFVIVNSQPNLFYMLFFMGQIFFYLLSLIGFFMVNYNIKISWFYIPYYFVFMNFAVFKGFFRYQSGKQTVLWEKAQRQKVTN